MGCQFDASKCPVQSLGDLTAVGGSTLSLSSALIRIPCTTGHVSIAQSHTMKRSSNWSKTCTCRAPLQEFVEKHQTVSWDVRGIAKACNPDISIQVFVGVNWRQNYGSGWWWIEVACLTSCLIARFAKGSAANFTCCRWTRFSPCSCCCSTASPLRSLSMGYSVGRPILPLFWSRYNTSLNLSANTLVSDCL